MVAVGAARWPGCGWRAVGAAAALQLARQACARGGARDFAAGP